ncbi:MAG TPA: pirin family protein, partial [Coleofasciculaceae cyanobacterium]
TSLREGETVNHQLADGRVAWVQVARGSVQLNDRSLTAGDGATVAQLEQIVLQGTSNDAEVLLFDMVA